MATFKVCVKNIRADKTYNVKIRVIHNRKTLYISSSYYINSNDVTKGGKIKRQDVLIACEDIIREYQDTIFKVKHIDDLSVSELVDLLKTKDNLEYIDFLSFGYTFLEDLMQKGFVNTALSYQTALNSFRNFLGVSTIDIRDINRVMVRKYIDYLVETNTGVKNARYAVYTNKLSALHNRMSELYNNDELDILLIKSNPFLKITLPDKIQTIKQTLSVIQIQEIASLKNSNKKMTIGIDLLIISFCLCGMNLRDIFECSDYTDGRITYQRTKTKRKRKDNAEISIMVEPEIQELIDKYKDPTGKRVFYFYNKYASYVSFSQTVLQCMTKLRDILSLGDTFSFYTARHSWATIARNDAMVDMYDVHQALNHADKSMAITDIYIRKDWSAIDRANRKVLDLIFKK